MTAATHPTAGPPAPTLPPPVPDGWVPADQRDGRVRPANDLAGRGPVGGVGVTASTAPRSSTPAPKWLDCAADSGSRMTKTCWLGASGGRMDKCEAISMVSLRWSEMTAWTGEVV